MLDPDPYPDPHWINADPKPCTSLQVFPLFKYGNYFFLNECTHWDPASAFPDGSGSVLYGEATSNSSRNRLHKSGGMGGQVVGGRVARLVVRPLATTALWVRIQTSLKIIKFICDSLSDSSPVSVAFGFEMTRRCCVGPERKYCGTGFSKQNYVSNKKYLLQTICICKFLIIWLWFDECSERTDPK